MKLSRILDLIKAKFNPKKMQEMYGESIFESDLFTGQTNDKGEKLLPSKENPNVRRWQKEEKAEQQEINFADEVISEEKEKQAPVKKERIVNNIMDRLRTKNYFEFYKPIVGKNGNTLYGYSWSYTIVSAFNRDGDEIPHRISDWGQSEESELTGRNIVHKFYIKQKDDKRFIVSSESLPEALGYTSDRSIKNSEIKDIAAACKKLAKNKTKLALLEAEKQEYLEKFNSLEEIQVKKLTVEEAINSGYYFPRLISEFRDGSIELYKVGDSYNVLYPHNTLENLIQDEKRDKIKKLGFRDLSGEIEPDIEKIKNKIKREERNINEYTKRAGEKESVTKNENKPKENKDFADETLEEHKTRLKSNPDNYIFELWKEYAEENNKERSNPNYIKFGQEKGLSDEIVDKLYEFNSKYINYPIGKYKVSSLEELNKFAKEDDEELERTRPARLSFINKYIDPNFGKEEENTTHETIKEVVNKDYDEKYKKTLNFKDLTPKNEKEKEDDFFLKNYEDTPKIKVKTHKGGNRPPSYTNTVEIKDGIIKVTNRDLSGTVADYSVEVKKWEELLKSFGNPHYNIKKFIEKENINSNPRNFYNRTPEDSSLVERVIDDQISLIHEAYKKYKEYKSDINKSRFIMENSLNFADEILKSKKSGDFKYKWSEAFPSNLFDKEEASQPELFTGQTDETGKKLLPSKNNPNIRRWQRDEEEQQIDFAEETIKEVDKKKEQVKPKKEKEKSEDYMDDIFGEEEKKEEEVKSDELKEKGKKEDYAEEIIKEKEGKKKSDMDYLADSEKRRYLELIAQRRNYMDVSGNMYMQGGDSSKEQKKIREKLADINANIKYYEDVIENNRKAEEKQKSDKKETENAKSEPEDDNVLKELINDPKTEDEKFINVLFKIYQTACSSRVWDRASQFEYYKDRLKEYTLVRVKSEMLSDIKSHTKAPFHVIQDIAIKISELPDTTAKEVQYDKIKEKLLNRENMLDVNELLPKDKQIDDKRTEKEKESYKVQEEIDTLLKKAYITPKNEWYQLGKDLIDKQEFATDSDKETMYIVYKDKYFDKVYDEIKKGEKIPQEVFDSLDDYEKKYIGRRHSLQAVIKKPKEDSEEPDFADEVIKDKGEENLQVDNTDDEIAERNADLLMKRNGTDPSKTKVKENLIKNAKKHIEKIRNKDKEMEIEIYRLPDHYNQLFEDVTGIKPVGNNVYDYFRNKLAPNTDKKEDKTGAKEKTENFADEVIKEEENKQENVEDKEQLKAELEKIIGDKIITIDTIRYAKVYPNPFKETLYNMYIDNEGIVNIDYGEVKFPNGFRHGKQNDVTMIAHGSAIHKDSKDRISYLGNAEEVFKHANKIKGQTFDIKDDLKSYGFKWNANDKIWEKESSINKEAEGTKSDYPTSIDTPAKKLLYDKLDKNEKLTIALDKAIKENMTEGWQDKFEFHKVNDAVSKVLREHGIGIFDAPGIKTFIKNIKDYK